MGATAGFLTDWGNSLKKREGEDAAEGLSNRIALRDRQADSIETAMKNLQQRASLPANAPGYVSPDELKFQLGEAQKQLSQLYQPHEGPDLMKRVKSIFGDKSAPTVQPTGTSTSPDITVGGGKSATATMPDVSVGGANIPGRTTEVSTPGVTIPGKATGVTLRPGMTLSDVLASGTPAPKEDAQGEVISKAPIMGADGNFFVLRKRPDGTIKQEPLPGFTQETMRQSLIREGFSNEQADKIMKIQFGLEPHADKLALHPRKPFEADVKDGIFMGVKDPNTGERYSRTEIEGGKAPADAKEVYADWKTGQGEKEAIADKKFQQTLQRQEQMFQNALDRSDYVAARRIVNTNETELSEAIKRQKTMHENITNALQKGDQQAMLSLVANHIGMTLGAQKGARITQAVWNEAVQSAPWLERVQSRFDDRGLLSGVTLSAEQMQQMVDLADEKVQILDKSVQDIKGRYKQELSMNQGRGANAGAGGSPKDKKKVSLAKAMALPVNKGKSEADVRKDIESKNYEVVP